VFLPLCGKTRDIAWLRARGHPVAGAELSRLAVEQLFDELGVAPQIVPEGALTRFRAEGLDVLVGDVFALTRDRLGPVAAVYDRAALVALPEGVRPRYGAHLHAISGGAPQLLVSFEYDQSARSGPPFSVDRAEVERVYGGLYRLRELARTTLRGGLRGGVAAEEVAWLLDRGAASPSAPPASR
jgi:thiopurine S-methyltransferase